MRLPYRVMALVLTGCALETATLQPSGDDFSREPNHRAVVANNIGTIVGDPSTWLWADGKQLGQPAQAMLASMASSRLFYANGF